MRELIRRLAARPLLSLELLAATFFVTLLNLASPLFVIQVLNRYITFGFDGTLFTLTAGAIIAVILLYGFRVVRTKISLAISVEPDELLTARVYNAMSRMKSLALDRMSRAKVQEVAGKLQAFTQAYEGPNITSVMDAPFSFMYIFVAFLLSPDLALLGLLAMGLMFLVSRLSLAGAEKPSTALQELGAAQRAHAATALHASDTVRAFLGGGFLRGVWTEQIKKSTDLRQRLAENRGMVQTLSQVVMMGASIVIYAVGAMEVVNGVLTVGALIGVNILTARAMQNVSRFAQISAQFKKAAEAKKEIDAFLAMPLEPETGTALAAYRGKVAFRDLAFAYPGSSGPLFESLELTLEPGAVLVVEGFNGSGKSTLARLAAGLIEPSRGEILVDGVNLRQVAPPWWRRQIMYLPQEPTFLNATFRENIGMANPDMTEENFTAVVTAANLGRFLHTSPKGLETEVTDSGRSLPLGVRRRLALARALATDGRLAILDEPTEGLDAEGCYAVYTLMNAMVKEGKTIIVVTHDQQILKGAHLRLDLSVKPVPAVQRARKPERAERPVPAPGAAAKQ